MQLLRHCLRALRRFLGRDVGRMVGIVLAGLLAGAAYGLLKPPTYTATAHVVVVAESEDGGATAVNFAQAYGRVAALPSTLAWASPLPRGTTTDQIRSGIQVSTSPDVPLVQISGSADTASEAVTLANAAADALVRYGGAHRHDTGVRVATMSQAVAPTEPSSPSFPVTVAVGGASGVLLAGMAQIAIRQRARVTGSAGRAPSGDRAVPSPATGGSLPASADGSGADAEPAEVRR
ncbi:hypothetical protein [Actinomadura kijaniata]|uniref:hypothetical protein n=1 Tax=Actinomadura kijaniata TaxID=46161 RepID=UPI000A057645|nr:hypothetical protein [Actinomadura kijaniata]